MEDTQTKKYFFLDRAVDHWNKLDLEDVDYRSANELKNKLDKLKKRKMGFFMDWVCFAKWLHVVRRTLDPGVAAPGKVRT